jgi:hypothetical protein
MTCHSPHCSSRAATPISKKAGAGAAAASQIYGDDDEGGASAKADPARSRARHRVESHLSRTSRLTSRCSDAITSSARVHWGWIQGLGIRCAAACRASDPPASSLTLRPAAPLRRSFTTACAAACFCARCTARAALPASTCSWPAAADCEQTGAERVRGGGGAEAKGEGAVHTQLQEVSGTRTRGGG